jgi:hypothetical protein
MRLNLDPKDAISTIRIAFTGQRLTAHGARSLGFISCINNAITQQLRQVLATRPPAPMLGIRPL